MISFLHRGLKGSIKSIKKIMITKTYFRLGLSKKFFNKKEKSIFCICTECPKSAVRGCKLILTKLKENKKNHRGIRKNLGKVKKYQVWVV